MSRSRPATVSRQASVHPRRSTRRALAGAALVVVIGLAAAAWVPGVLRRASPEPGPIILISIDTLRADHLPAYGYRGVATPAIDALAARGVLFERAYAHVPQTLPSHVSMLTGELPFEHGVRDNLGFAVKPGQRLLQTLLRARGYTTAGFVSAFILRKETGLAQGFDVYDAEMPPAGPAATFSSVRRDGADTLARVEGWLSRQRSPRFFLFVHFYEPHRPYRPPARYAQYANPYDGTIAYVDELVGRLVADLAARNLYDPATIALVADHGEGLGDHGEQEHGVFLYDSTLRVPAIVKLPGGRDAGRRVASPVEHIDLVPTLLDLAGVEVPRDLHGVSWRAAMDGAGGGIADRGLYAETLYPLYHFGWSPLYALTDPRYRYIKAPRPELYDLVRDGGETENLESVRPQTASSMQAALDRLAAGSTIARPTSTSGADLEHFQALGYIGSARVPAATDTERLPDPKDRIAALAAYRRAVDLRSAQRLPEAAAAFREVLADNPSMVDVWSQLAAVLSAQGLATEAADALQRAVALDPGIAENQLALSSALLTIGRLDAAAGHARAALAQRPGPAHELLARMALARGDQAGALVEAKLATDAQGDLAFPLYVQGVALAAQGRHADALALFSRALASLDAQHARMAGVHLASADARAPHERVEEARAQFEAEIAAFPQDGRARIGLAMLYRAQGRVREANETIAAMLQATPTPANFVVAARTLQAFGEPDTGRQVIAQGLQRFPGNRDLLAARAALFR